VVNDTISDMLTRLRNANLAKHQIVEVPSTKMTRNIAGILLEEGFIQSFEEVGESFNSQLLLSLKYFEFWYCYNKFCTPGPHIA
jgi:small subunit ribosomal protein S8